MRRSSAYRLFLTENSEYHVRGSVCCGVRDRRTGQWFQSHIALGAPLAGSYADRGGRVLGGSIPMIGEALVFSVHGRPVETSTVLGIEEREAIDLGVPGGGVGGGDDVAAGLVSRSHRRRVSHTTHEMPSKP